MCLVIDGKPGYLYARLQGSLPAGGDRTNVRARSCYFLQLRLKFEFEAGICRGLCSWHVSKSIAQFLLPWLLMIKFRKHRLQAFCVTFTPPLGGSRVVQPVSGAVHNLILVINKMSLPKELNTMIFFALFTLKSTDVRKLMSFII